MKYVLLVFQGTTPLPGTDRWKALPEVEQKRIYADHAALNQTPGMTPGLPLGLPGAARTVMEAAIAMAARIPAARLGGAVEIRPAETYW